MKDTMKMCFVYALFLAYMFAGTVVCIKMFPAIRSDVAILFISCMLFLFAGVATYFTAKLFIDVEK